MSALTNLIIWPFWNSKERRLRAGWRFLLHLVATLGVLTAFMVFIGVVFRPDIDSPPFMVFGTVCQQVIVMVVVLLACLWPDRRRLRDIGLNINRRWWLDLFGGMTLGAVLIGVIFVIEYQNGWIKIGESDYDFGQTFRLQLGWLLAMVFVGTGEEIMSRGYQLKNLTEGFRRAGVGTSFAIATLLSSMMFGLLHVFNPNASVIATVAVVMSGVMFCAGRLLTGSLAAPIGMHIAWNYCEGAVFGFPISGITVEGSLITIDSTVDSIWTGGDFGPEAGLLGLFSIIAAIVVFALWPGARTDWRVHLVRLARFRRRVPRGR